MINESRSELDSHADTSVVGMNCLITHNYDKTVIVTRFDPSQGSVKDLKVVSAALAYMIVLSLVRCLFLS